MSPGVGVGVAAAVVDVFFVAQLVTNKVAIMQGRQKTRAHFVNLAELIWLITKSPLTLRPRASALSQTIDCSCSDDFSP